MSSKLLFNVGIPVLAAVLGFFGAVGGSYISASHSERLWEKQESLAQDKAIFEKRVALLERVSELANISKKYEAYQSYMVFQKDLARIYADCTARGEKGCVQPDGVKEALELSIKRADLNAQFSSTFQLVEVYFGDETDKVAHELSLIKNWWKEGEPLFRSLLTSMSKELNTKN